MTLLLSAEWMRFRSHRNNLLIGAMLFLLLCASAWFAGGAASAYRQLERERITAWDIYLARQAKALPETSVSPGQDAARKAYDFGRADAPPALRPAPGGLVLAVRQFHKQPFDVKVSLDSRHLDPRRGAPLGNPLLESFGIPDFAVVVALLVPLAVIALAYDLVHEARERGIWPLIRAQAGSPARLVLAALTVRFLIVLGVASMASALAFALDPGAIGTDFLVWLGCMALYTLLWVLTAGLFNLTRLSSAGSALGLIALWLVINVVFPAWLSRYAEARVPLPAREATVIALRSVQHEAEERMPALLDDWYARHPQHRPAGVQNHTWPVTYVPKTIWQDRQIAGMMARFNHARLEQAEVLGPLLWLAPGLALTRSADRLAGADPAQFDSYAKGVEALEERWRAILAPSVMSYRGLSTSEMRDVRGLGKGQP